MAKKRIGGIDNLIKSTIQSEEDKIEGKITIEEQIVPLHIRIPSELKRKIDIAAAKNSIKKQDLMMKIISEYFDKNPVE